MKTKQDRPEDPPSTIAQLAAAMAALGKYTGANSDAEHAAEVARLGSASYYRLLLANALLGIVEFDALLQDEAARVSEEQLLSAHRQALSAAGVEGEPAKLLLFLQWRALRVAGPLRVAAQDETTGPVVLAAAHAAEGLQQLLHVSAAGQHPDRLNARALTKDLKAARAPLTNAVTNIDIMLGLVQHANDLVP